MKYNFQVMHNMDIGDEIATNGYPDDCDGRYTDKFGYGAWYFLNIIKRCHRNDFEHLVTVLPLSLLNGIVYP